MLDVRAIRERPEEIERGLKSKDPTLSLKDIIELDTRIRELKSEIEALKARRNEVSKEIGQLRRNGEDAAALIEKMGGVGDQIDALEKELSKKTGQFDALFYALPQLPMSTAPISHDEADNIELKRWGEPHAFSYTPKNHLELGAALGLFDLKRSAKITGSGWPLFTGLGARLEWALINFMIDAQKKAGYEMMLPPHLVRPDAMFGVGQLPKFGDQLFRVQDDDYDLFLLPTAEAALGALYSGEILENSEVPKRLFAYTPCFRREAGAAGSSDRGLIRTHQFNKVEMFAFTRPEESPAIFIEMVELAESILEGLDLPYRRMELVTGDMPFSAAKTYDLEVWLPGQDRYYECSSISNCLDFQARRSKTRFRREAGSSPEMLHTLNGSGLATSRVMCGLIENNQRADGSMGIPEKLQPYFDGIEEITP